MDGQEILGIVEGITLDENDEPINAHKIKVRKASKKLQKKSKKKDKKKESKKQKEKRENKETKDKKEDKKASAKKKMDVFKALAEKRKVKRGEERR